MAVLGMVGGFYNVLASAAITFFTVTAGFLEIMLASPPVDEKSAWGLGAGTTMILHGLGGVLLLGAIAAMAVWRGLQRYRWRREFLTVIILQLFPLKIARLLWRMMSRE